MATTPNPPQPPRPSGPTRPVTCYHCGHGFEIAARAMSSSCPKCSKPLSVQDVVVKTAHFVRKIQTCGRIVVEAKGQLNAALIHAQLGVEVLGSIEGNVTSGGLVLIGAKAKWKGDCRAPALAVEGGATITRGFFEVPFDALATDNRAHDGSADEHGVEEAPPAGPQVRAISTRRPLQVTPSETEAKPAKKESDEARAVEADGDTQARPAKKITTRKPRPETTPRVTIAKPPSAKPPPMGKPPKGTKKKR